VIIGGKPINPGEMRTSVTLQKRTVATQTGGFKTETPVDVATVWAKWTNVHGQEVWAAQTVNARQPATVLIRYRSDIDPTWYVVKDSERYEIVSLDDIQNRHEYIELKVVRVVEG